MMRRDATPFLFVYGTLLQGPRNRMARYLSLHAAPAGRGAFPGHLYDLGAYPGAVYDPAAKHRVHGRIFELGDPGDVLRVLDAYEGCGAGFPQPNEYVRSVVPVHRDGAPVPCWVYLYNHPTDHLRPIPSGDYLAYSTKRKSG